MFEFAQPWVLALTPVLVAILLVARRRTEGEGAVRHPSLDLFGPAPAGWRVRARPWLFRARVLALVLALVALARPRLADTTRVVEGEGVDIVVALDISGSMRALDFQPRDRLGVAKEVIREFIAGRPADRIGLVVFASRAFTQCPLTLDRSVLLGFLDEVNVGLIEDGTAIGLGLATAINRLKQSPARGRTVILLTDGLNNVPTLEPMTAAGVAGTLGVRVYTVGLRAKNGDRLLAAWLQERATDDGCAERTALTVEAGDAVRATAFDVLNGTEQALRIVRREGRITIPDLVIRDWPIVIRLCRGG